MDYPKSYPKCKCPHCGFTKNVYKVEVPRLYGPSKSHMICGSCFSTSKHFDQKDAIPVSWRS